MKQFIKDKIMKKLFFSGFKKYFGEEKGMRRTEYGKQGKIQIINTKNTP